MDALLDQLRRPTPQDQIGDVTKRGLTTAETGPLNADIAAAVNFPTFPRAGILLEDEVRYAGNTRDVMPESPGPIAELRRQLRVMTGWKNALQLQISKQLDAARQQQQAYQLLDVQARDLQKQLDETRKTVADLEVLVKLQHDRIDTLSMGDGYK
jgi:hypothetical protein